MIPPNIQMCLMVANSVSICATLSFQSHLGNNWHAPSEVQEVQVQQLNGQHSSVYWGAEAGMKGWLWSHQY